MIHLRAIAKLDADLLTLVVERVGEGVIRLDHILLGDRVLPRDVVDTGGELGVMLSHFVGDVLQDRNQLLVLTGDKTGGVDAGEGETGVGQLVHDVLGHLSIRRVHCHRDAEGDAGDLDLVGIETRDLLDALAEVSGVHQLLDLLRDERRLPIEAETFLHHILERRDAFVVVLEGGEAALGMIDEPAAHRLELGVHVVDSRPKICHPLVEFGRQHLGDGASEFVLARDLGKAGGLELGVDANRAVLHVRGIHVGVTFRVVCCVLC